MGHNTPIYASQRYSSLHAKSAMGNMFMMKHTFVACRAMNLIQPGTHTMDG